jgi:hypothetical protein
MHFIADSTCGSVAMTWEIVSGELHPIDTLAGASAFETHPEWHHGMLPLLSDVDPVANPHVCGDL